jgi:hypothetical protein
MESTISVKSARKCEKCDNSFVQAKWDRRPAARAREYRYSRV